MLHVSSFSGKRFLIRQIIKKSFGIFFRGIGFLILIILLSTDTFGQYVDVTLEIVNQRGDDAYYPEDQLMISVRKKNPMIAGDVNKVWFMIGLKEIIDEAAPFECQYRIHEKDIGPLTIYALVEDADGSRSEIQKDIRVQLKTEIKEIKLIYRDRNIEMNRLKQTHQLHVRGILEKGARSVSYKKYGTTYQSTNPGVVSVSENGLVTSEEYGEAEIIIRNGAHEIKSIVRVVRPY